jgi:single-stranded-DNA-specific exonuclease RecJ
MQNKLWVYRDCEEDMVCRIASEAGISKLMAGVFAARGFTEPDYIREFLEPSLDKLHSPFLLLDVDKAVDRIIKAIEEKEKIIIYGDYDVDGVTSTSVLLDFLLSQGADADYYIPDRFDEGYGLNAAAVEKVIQKGARLVITVDCGITAMDEVNLFNENNITVIITDHHECKDLLPNAYAVINPHRKDCDYPFKELAGVGVVFKLVHALCLVMQADNLYLKYLDLVTLGTIADIVKLLDENRIIVKFGLAAIENTHNVGLKALIAVSGLGDKPINTYGVGFALAPRINAAGRTGSAARAVSLLTTSDAKLAEKIAMELNEENKYRQETEKDILQQSIEYVENNIDLVKENVIVAVGKGWHHGIIGIVASRITERYYRPCILISEEDGVGKGSGRSIEGFNLFEALSNCEDLLVKFGGHELAAGLSLDIANLSEFRDRINGYANTVLTEKELTPVVKIDYVVKKEEISLESVSDLEKLAPFGPGNAGPVFCFENLKITDIRSIGEKKHLKLRLEDNGFFIDAVGFNMGELVNSYTASSVLDSAFTLEINNWNNTSRVQMILKDLRPHNAIVFDNSNGYNINKLEDMVPKRNDLVAVYQFVRNNGGEGIRQQSGKEFIAEDLSELTNLIFKKYGVMMNQFKLVKCLEIFEELKLLKKDKYGEKGLIIVLTGNGKQKVSIEDSKIFRELQGLKESDVNIDNKAM